MPRSAVRGFATTAGMAPLVVALALIAAHPAAAGTGPGARIAATCSDYQTQADAQRAADTRDSDGDGVYCESLPCPCLRPGSNTPAPAPVAPRRSCTRPRAVQVLVFSRRRYPNIRRHTIRAVRRAGRA